MWGIICIMTKNNKSSISLHTYISTYNFIAVYSVKRIELCSVAAFNIVTPVQANLSVIYRDPSKLINL